MKKLLILLVVVGVLLMGLAYWISPGTAGSRNDVLFEYRPVERGLLVETVSATGQISPHEVSLVFSPMGGQVIKIFENADFNRYVEENEPLLQLDPALAEVKLEQARAAVLAARTDVIRAVAQRDAAHVALQFQKELLEKGVGQKAKVEEAEYLSSAAVAAVDAARAKVKMAEKARDEAQLGLDRTIIRAPAAGLIIDRKVYLGQLVGPQLTIPLFKIASDLRQMDVQAQIAEGDVSRVQPGQPAVFTVYAYSEANVRFEGKVKQIHYMPNSIQGAVFYNTVIQVANRRAPATQDTWERVGGMLSATPIAPTTGLPWLCLRQEEPWMLRPGMTATVDVIRRRHPNAWKMPLEALSVQLDEYYQTAEAREKVKEWQSRRDADDWKHVWVHDPSRNHNKPWPLFVRINGVTAGGEPGIKDSQFLEVLEWDPEIAGKINPANPRTFPQVIISAPPVSKPGLFDLQKPTRIIS